MRSRVASAVALLALAVPAAASAHPGVYKVAQKVAPGGCVFPNTGCFGTDRAQYVVASDGYAIGLTESNSVTGVQGDGTAGVVDFKQMPGTWRAAPMTAEQKLGYGPAQTDVQAHATCSGSALLDTPANVWAWQQRADNDPFFNYIPWQKTPAGLGDDPGKWIALVKNVTGVDLSTLATDAQFKAACESAPVSGTYHAADTIASVTTAMVSDAINPLQTQIGTLQGQLTTLQAAKAASDAAAAAALKRPLALTLSAKTFELPVAMVTGVPGTSVKVRMLLGAADARRLKVARTAASRTKTLGPAGAELLTLTTSKKVAASRRALKVTIEAAAGGTTLTSKGTLR